jgi:integrase
MCFFLEGKRIRLSTHTSNKRLAQKIYEKTKWEIATGNFKSRKRESMPFFELVDHFIEKHSKVEKASWKRDFFIGEALKKYFGKTPIGEITAYDIKAWREWRSKHITNKGTPIKKASLNRELAFLKTMFNLAVEWGWLDENPASKVKLLKGEEKRLRILTKEELQRLIDCAREPLKTIIILAASTGMRKSEILNLRWKDVDFEHGFIRVENSKNSESRDVPMDDFLKKKILSLKCERRTNDFIFSRKNGERIHCIKEAFKAACKRAGISDFRFHDLRHTAASLLAAGGCDIITLQHILGHKTLAMTQRYAHLIPGRHERAKQIMTHIWSEGATKQPQSFDRQKVHHVSY